MAILYFDIVFFLLGIPVQVIMYWFSFCWPKILSFTENHIEMFIIHAWIFKENELQNAFCICVHVQATCCMKLCFTCCLYFWDVTFSLFYKLNPYFCCFYQNSPASMFSIFSSLQFFLNKLLIKFCQKSLHSFIFKLR